MSSTEGDSPARKPRRLRRGLLALLLVGVAGTLLWFYGPAGGGAQPVEWVGREDLHLIQPRGSKWTGDKIVGESPPPDGTRYRITTAFDEWSEPIAETGWLESEPWEPEPGVFRIMWLLTPGERARFLHGEKVLIRLYEMAEGGSAELAVEHWVTIEIRS